MTPRSANRRPSECCPNHMRCEVPVCHFLVFLGDRQASDRRQTSDAHRRFMLPPYGYGGITKKVIKQRICSFLGTLRYINALNNNNNYMNNNG